MSITYLYILKYYFFFNYVFSDCSKRVTWYLLSLVHNSATRHCQWTNIRLIRTNSPELDRLWLLFHIAHVQPLLEVPFHSQPCSIAQARPRRDRSPSVASVQSLEDVATAGDLILVISYLMKRKRLFLWGGSQRVRVHLCLMLRPWEIQNMRAWGMFFFVSSLSYWSCHPTTWGGSGRTDTCIYQSHAGCGGDLSSMIFYLSYLKLQNLHKRWGPIHSRLGPYEARTVDFLQHSCVCLRSSESMASEQMVTVEVSAETPYRPSPSQNFQNLHPWSQRPSLW